MQLQCSLFDSPTPSGPQQPRPLDLLATRHRLDGGAWVDVAPGWLPGSDQLFERLHCRVPWRSERRTMYDRRVDVPRLAAFYEAHERLPDPALDLARVALDAHYRGTYGEPFATAGLCLYRDGNDSVAFHGDRIGRGGTHDTLVAILSLGGPRRLLLRRRGGGPSLRFSLCSGDLLVMGGSCQRTWEHAIPKTARATGPRISVQFRPAGVR